MPWLVAGSVIVWLAVQVLIVGGLIRIRRAGQKEASRIRIARVMIAAAVVGLINTGITVFMVFTVLRQ